MVPRSTETSTLSPRLLWEQTVSSMETSSLWPQSLWEPAARLLALFKQALPSPWEPMPTLVSAFMLGLTSPLEPTATFPELPSVTLESSTMALAQLLATEQLSQRLLVPTSPTLLSTPSTTETSAAPRLSPPALTQR